MAAEHHHTPSLSIVVHGDQPLLGVIEVEDGQQVTRYFTEENAPDTDELSDDIKAALSAIGAWSDLDWDEAEAALYRIRHESKPTPPIEL